MQKWELVAFLTNACGDRVAITKINLHTLQVKLISKDRKMKWGSIGEASSKSREAEKFVLEKGKLLIQNS